MIKFVGFHLQVSEITDNTSIIATSAIVASPTITDDILEKLGHAGLKLRGSPKAIYQSMAPRVVGWNLFNVALHLRHRSIDCVDQLRDLARYSVEALVIRPRLLPVRKATNISRHKELPPTHNEKVKTHTAILSISEIRELVTAPMPGMGTMELTP